LSRSCSWARNVRQSCSSVPSSSHSRSRRQQVTGLPYSRGNARHGAPVHSTHRIPSKHRRSSARGRPPCGLTLRFGRWALITSHCRSLKRLQAIAVPPCGEKRSEGPARRDLTPSYGF
jgi:hypothetical protein